MDTRKSVKEFVKNQGWIDLSKSIIGYKTITIRYMDYVGNHHAGCDQGDDLMKIAQCAVYLDTGIIKTEAVNSFNRCMIVRLTYAEFMSMWAWSLKL